MIDELIKTGEKLSDSIVYVPPSGNLIRTYKVYKSVWETDYQEWQSLVLRFIKNSYPNDLKEIEDALVKIDPSNHIKIISIMKAIKIIPDGSKMIPSEKKDIISQININNNQYNSQQITLNIFIEAVKNELTDKQFLELKEIIKANKEEPEEMKSKIIEKIKGFGEGVMSNILAGILINPAIYANVM
jgi:hypothetical protein